MQGHIVNPQTCGPSAIPIVARISAQATRHPTRTAVADDTTQLTFAELEQLVQRLAAQLQVEGAGPEICVGLFLERSTDFVLGGVGRVENRRLADSPLDPATPPDRAWR